MKASAAIIIALCCLSSLALAQDRPANSDVAVNETFSESKLGKGWNATTGEWKVEGGVLRGAEIPKEKHSAAIRRVAVTENAVYQLRFRLLKDAKAFHFGFDPARGELKRKGHLFSVIVTPKSWQILKHVDKTRRKEDPNKVLAEADAKFESGEWQTLRVTTWGPYVTARIDGKGELKASHSDFAVKKPTLIFRCLGDGVEVDDIRVWTPKKR